MPEEGEGTSKDRYRDIAPVAARAGGRGADKHVARHAAEITGGERQHHDAEEIEPALYAGRRAAEREDEGPEQIEDEHKALSVPCNPGERADDHRFHAGLERRMQHWREERAVVARYL